MYAYGDPVISGMNPRKMMSAVMAGAESTDATRTDKLSFYRPSGYPLVTECQVI